MFSNKSKLHFIRWTFCRVDPIAVEDIQKIVRSLVDKNIGILITDHNVQQTLAITHKTYIMFEGKIWKKVFRKILLMTPKYVRHILEKTLDSKSFNPYLRVA